MRKIVIGAVGVTSALALTTVALAQNPSPVVTATGSITPKKAGTKSKPKGATFKFKVVNSAESKSTVSDIRLKLPKGVRLDGTNLKACSEATLHSGGSAKCAKGSKLGQGVAYAFLIDQAQPAPDCPGTKGKAAGCLTFKSEFFVGGKRQLNVWLTGQNGLDVQEVLPSKISKDGTTLDIHILESLQQPVQGTYAALAQLDGSWKGSAKKGGKTYNFVSTTACSGKKWTVESTLTYAANKLPAPVKTAKDTFTSACS